MPSVISDGRLKIISDGTGRTTKVLDADGNPVKFGRAGLVKVEIRPIEADAFVQAILYVDMPELEIWATPVLPSESETHD